MTANPKSFPIVVEPGELGPAPVTRFPAGEWPEGVPRNEREDEPGREGGRIARWAIARGGGCEGYYGEPVWYERGFVISDRDGCTVPGLVPVCAYGIWKIGEPCPLTIVDCVQLGCREAGSCRRKR